MRITKKYKIIAFFFLVVFSSNPILGFACSIGMDMGYNAKHHHDEPGMQAVVHIHADGQTHHHIEKKAAHNHSKSHQDHKASGHSKSSTDKNDCCSDEVAKFAHIDKTVPEQLNILHPVFVAALFDVFFSVGLPSFYIIKDIKQFVRSYHPPIPDIRISIQSFQI